MSPADHRRTAAPRVRRTRLLGCTGGRAAGSGPRGARCRRGGARRGGPSRPGGDGRGRRQGDGRPAAPPCPGRHRHRQVAGLPRPRAAPPRPGRRRHRDPRPAAPARGARHPRPARGGAGGARARRGEVRQLRRPEGPLELRLPAPRARGGPRRPGRARRPAPGLGRRRGRRPARVGRGGGDRRGHRRARQRPTTHRPGVAPGQRDPPRVPRCGQVPLRRGVLRRACPRAGDALAAGGHQPLPAGHRRRRGRPDAAGVRRGGRRRGPRAGGSGDPGRHRRALRRRRGARRPSRPAAHRPFDK